MRMQGKNIVAVNVKKKRIVRRVESVQPETLPIVAPLNTDPQRDDAAKKAQKAPVVDAIINSTIYGMVFLMPIFVLPFMSDPVELAKQTFLFAGVFILVLCYSIKIATQGKWEFRGGMWIIGAVVLLIAWLAASIFSLFPYNSFLGLGGQQAISFGTLAAFIILAFVFN